ncbi:27274_t:CDS:2 [Dentiscutata erythropus]|uniref:27274_t:CDS:1 n=1 Tax=Dentiscutata erythropus TaxID=1348616 RepID=A0A9N8W8T1_9GLOM|nr:27274_t:CDS:2 [Dentiscutata erythropus]
MNYNVLPLLQRQKLYHFIPFNSQGTQEASELRDSIFLAPMKFKDSISC